MKYKNKDGIELSFTGNDSVTLLVKEVINETIRILNSDDYTHKSKVLGLDKTFEAIEFLKENFNKGVRVAEKKELTEQDLIWSSMPTAMFILMPFMAFCVYLLNKKKKQLYSYHLITVLHFHSFIF